MPEGLTPALPLAGVRVLEYAQYVAGPFAGMLLADLGADVIKVEPPAGDAWRNYEPFEAAESRYFYALNRNKRSVVLDLKSADGRRASRALIADRRRGAPQPAARARSAPSGSTASGARDQPARGLVLRVGAGQRRPRGCGDRVRSRGAGAVGLLLANAVLRARCPQRAGGIAMADFTAGLLAAIAVLAGLLAASATSAAPGLEVSLLGAALAVQAQSFVSVEGLDRAARDARLAGPAVATRRRSRAASRSAASRDEPGAVLPRLRRPPTGSSSLACLNERQRAAAAGVLGLDGSLVGQSAGAPRHVEERDRRVALVE